MRLNPRTITAAAMMLAVGGLLMVSNALIAGRHAFSGGGVAVTAMVAAGFACLSAGVWQLYRSSAFKWRQR